jgi:hypothetical protein
VLLVASFSGTVWSYIPLKICLNKEKRLEVSLRTLFFMTMGRPRRLFTGLLLRRPGFYLKIFYVEFVVDKLTLRQVFIPVAVFPCRYHSNSPPDSRLIHLPLTFYVCLFVCFLGVTTLLVVFFTAP